MFFIEKEKKRKKKKKGKSLCTRENTNAQGRSIPYYQRPIRTVSINKVAHFGELYILPPANVNYDLNSFLSSWYYSDKPKLPGAVRNIYSPTKPPLLVMYLCWLAIKIYWNKERAPLFAQKPKGSVGKINKAHTSLSKRQLWNEEKRRWRLRYGLAMKEFGIWERPLQVKAPQLQRRLNFSFWNTFESPLLRPNYLRTKSPF